MSAQRMHFQRAHTADLGRLDANHARLLLGLAALVLVRRQRRSVVETASGRDYVDQVWITVWPVIQTTTGTRAIHPAARM